MGKLTKQLESLRAFKNVGDWSLPEAKITDSLGNELLKTNQNKMKTAIVG